MKNTYEYIVEAEPGSDIEHVGEIEAESIADCWKQIKTDPILKHDKILKRRIRLIPPPDMG